VLSLFICFGVYLGCCTFGLSVREVDSQANGRENFSIATSGESRLPSQWPDQRQHFVITSAKEVMRLVLFVCHSFVLPACVQDYCKINQLISLKHSLMIGSTNQKNWLTFAGDPVPRTRWFSITFHFAYYCGIGDFRRFIGISHTLTGRFLVLQHSAKWLTLTRQWIHNILAAIQH